MSAFFWPGFARARAGAAEFLPTSIANNVLWLDAADTSTITESSGLVSQWDDKSGLGNDVTQGSGSLQPTTGTETINNVNVITFADSTMSSSDYAATDNWTAFTVVEGDAAPTNTDASGPIKKDKNIQINWNHGSGTFRGAVALSVSSSFFAASLGSLSGSTPYILAGSYDGEEIIASLDGTIITTNTSPSGDADAESADMFIGGTGVSGSFFDGKIAEIIIFSRKLNTDEIDQVEAYLSTKWGVSI